MEQEIIEPDELKIRKKVPQKIKDKIINLTFFNCVFLILMSVITLVINITYNKLILYDFRNYIKILQLLLCIISIVLFEVSYKKDSMKIGFFAIEFTIFSVFILFVPYRYMLKSDVQFLRNALIVFSIYYLIKVGISSILIRNKYLKENMSDVKEIVKDDKKGYIDEESVKTLKERKIEEEKIKLSNSIKTKKKIKTKKVIQNQKLDKNKKEE